MVDMQKEFARRLFLAIPSGARIWDTVSLGTQGFVILDECPYIDENADYDYLNYVRYIQRFENGVTLQWFLTHKESELIESQRDNLYEDPARGILLEKIELFIEPGWLPPASVRQQIRPEA